MLIVLSVVNIILIAYLFVLALRIVLGWFAPQALGRAWELLTAATDPYLKVFSRIRFLRGNLFDFSPIAAILTLVVALDLVNQLLYYGRLTLGFFLAAVFSAAEWMMLTWLAPSWRMALVTCRSRFTTFSSIWWIMPASRKCTLRM